MCTIITSSQTRSAVTALLSGLAWLPLSALCAYDFMSLFVFDWIMNQLLCVTSKKSYLKNSLHNACTTQRCARAVVENRLGPLDFFRPQNTFICKTQSFWHHLHQIAILHLLIFVNIFQYLFVFVEICLSLLVFDGISLYLYVFVNSCLYLFVFANICLYSFVLFVFVEICW